MLSQVDGGKLFGHEPVNESVLPHRFRVRPFFITFFPANSTVEIVIELSFQQHAKDLEHVRKVSFRKTHFASMLM